MQRNDNDTEERDPLNLSGEENQDEIIPSNQLAAGNHSQRDNASQSGSRQPVRGSQDEEDEDDLESWGILTQYIGPSTKPKTNNHSDDEDRKHQAASKELDSFKKQYTADTDLRDRADNHLESLNRAVRKGRTPKGLTVDVQPNCVKKEDPTLKSEWTTCKATAEHGFTNILTRHLERVSKDTHVLCRTHIKAQPTDYITNDTPTQTTELIESQPTMEQRLNTHMYTCM